MNRKSEGEYRETNQGMELKHLLYLAAKPSA